MTHFTLPGLVLFPSLLLIHSSQLVSLNPKSHFLAFISNRDLLILSDITFIGSVWPISLPYQRTSILLLYVFALRIPLMISSY